MCRQRNKRKTHNRNISETVNVLDQTMVKIPDVSKTHQHGAAALGIRTQYWGNVGSEDNIYTGTVSHINMTPCSVEASKADDINELYGNNDLLKVKS